MFIKCVCVWHWQSVRSTTYAMPFRVYVNTVCLTVEGYVWYLEWVQQALGSHLEMSSLLFLFGNRQPSPYLSSRSSQESTWSRFVVYSTLCLHLQGERVKLYRAQLLVKHTQGKETFSWDERCLGSFLSSTPSFSVWQRNSFLGLAILGLMTLTGMSPHFLSFLTSLCRQLCLCVSACLYLHGNGGRGKPIINRQNLTKKFLHCSNQQYPRIEAAEPQGLVCSLTYWSTKVGREQMEVLSYFI